MYSPLEQDLSILVRRLANCLSRNHALRISSLSFLDRKGLNGDFMRRHSERRLTAESKGWVFKKNKSGTFTARKKRSDHWVKIGPKDILELIEDIEISDRELEQTQ